MHEIICKFRPKYYSFQQFELLKKRSNAKQNLAINHGHNILRLPMFGKTFLSPQVKRSLITNNKHIIYQLPYKLPNDLRLRVLVKYEISGKCQNFKELQPSGQYSSQNENFINTRKKLFEKQKLNFSCSSRSHIKIRVCLKHFVLDCIRKQVLLLTHARPL